jgi:hypothetical protein
VLLKMGLPKFGFPAPAPIPQKDADVSFDAEGNLWLSARISGTRFNLRLAHHRQLLRARQSCSLQSQTKAVVYCKPHPKYSAAAT